MNLTLGVVGAPTPIIALERLVCTKMASRRWKVTSLKSTTGLIWNATMLRWFWKVRRCPYTRMYVPTLRASGDRLLHQCQSERVVGVARASEFLRLMGRTLLTRPLLQNRGDDAK